MTRKLTINDECRAQLRMQFTELLSIEVKCRFAFEAVAKLLLPIL